MFQLTDEAKKQLDQHFKDQDASSIRVYLAPG